MLRNWKCLTVEILLLFFCKYSRWQSNFHFCFSTSKRLTWKCASMKFLLLYADHVKWMDRYANCTIYLLMMASLEFEFNFYLPRLASIFKWIFPHDFVQFQIHTEYKLNLNLLRDLSYVCSILVWSLLFCQSNFVSNMLAKFISWPQTLESQSAPPLFSTN